MCVWGEEEEGGRKGGRGGREGGTSLQALGGGGPVQIASAQWLSRFLTCPKRGRPLGLTREPSVPVCDHVAACSCMQTCFESVRRPARIAASTPYTYVPLVEVPPGMLDVDLLVY